MRRTILKTVLPAIIMLVFTGASAQAPGLTKHNFPEDVSRYHFVINNAMLADDAGKLWMGSQSYQQYHGLLASYFGGEWEFFSTQNSPMPSDTTYSLFWYDNKLYIGTAQGLAIYDGNWNIVDTSAGLPGNHVTALHVSHDALLAGTTNGLGVFVHNQWIHYNTANSGIAGNHIQALATGANGTLWVATTEGLSAFSNNAWTTYNSENSALTGNDIRALLVDKNNQLWIGTWGHGIYRMIDSDVVPVSDLYPVFRKNDFTVRSMAMNDDGKVIALVRLDREVVVVMLDEHEAMLFTTGMNMSSSLITFNDSLVWLMFPVNLYSFNLAEGIMHDALQRLVINNISADFTAGGMLAWDSYHDSPHFEAPKGSGKHTLFVNTLWIGAKSEDTVMHYSGPIYRSRGRDYWPGPVSASPEVYQAEQEKWNRIWKLSKAEIDYHKLHWNQPAYNMPHAMATWPAHGDITAGQEFHIAPFVDVSGSGIYEPQHGDYPVIRGDQALFFVYNDHRFPNTDSEGNNLSIEVRVMAYAFDKPADSALHHTIFVNYQIVNRSGQDYDSVYVGFFTDFDIGHHTDDYMGCDTLLNAYFAYNATPVDGSGQPHAYGEHPPAQSVVFLNRELTVHIRPERLPGLGIWPTPFTPLQRYLMLQGIWYDGTPMLHGGYGHINHGGGTERAWHLFPGDITDPDQWHEFSTPESSPGDRRSLGSNFIGAFEHGQIICFDKAFVYARDYEGDHISSVTLMKERIQQVQNYFDANLANDCSDLLATSVIEVHRPSRRLLHCYPNPAQNTLTLEFVPQSDQAKYYLYNSMGALVRSQRIESGITSVPLHGLSPGLYIIKVEDGENVLYQKIIRK